MMIFLAFRLLPWIVFGLLLWLGISWVNQKSESDEIFRQVDLYWAKAQKTDDVDRKLEYYRNIETILSASYDKLSGAKAFEKAHENLEDVDVMIRKYMKIKKDQDARFS